MKTLYLKNKNKFLLSALFLFQGLGLINAQSPVTQTFGFTGSMQSFTVPSCVGTVSITAYGAQGGINGALSTQGGKGGMAVGSISVTPGTVLNIYVGGTNGFNGGGAAGINVGCAGASAGVGGGASDIRLNGIALSNRIIVAGGGGGGGGDRINTCGRGAGGGGGGGYYGGGGGAGYPSGSTVFPTGGTQIAGGIAGTSSFSSGQNGTAGTLGFGGSGGGETGTNQGGGGTALIGGEGGGLVGGNGQVVSPTIYTGHSGAGGSSYVSGLIGGSTTSSVQLGNGLVTLSYNFNGNGVAAGSPSLSICSGQSSTLSASGMNSYTWSTGSFSNAIVVNPISTTSYTVSGTNSVGCVSSSILTVTVSAGVPTLAVSSSTNQTCLGKTATLTATGALSYTWSNNVSNGVSFSPSVTTSYTVLGNNGCGTSSAVTSITVAPLPVSAIVSPTLTCAGSGATLLATSAATSYTWLPNNSNTTTAIVSPTSTIVYTISVSDGTCSGLANVTLSVNPIPTISVVASSSTACQGGVITMTASGGTGYTWTPGNIGGSVVTFTPGSSTLYNCVGSNSFNCTSSANQVVVTQPSPTITLVASDNLICGGSSATITASGANTYSWSNNSSNPVLTVSPANTTLYSVTGYSTGNACTTTQTIQIAVFNPSTAISGPTAICNGGTATLTASGADTYQWDNGAPVPIIAVNPIATTVYTVSALTATGNINCASTATIQVVVNPNPTVTVVPTRTFMCIKESNTLTASGAGSYSWNTTETTAAIVVSSTIATTINYTVTGTDATGCKNVKVYQLKINGCTGVNELSYNTNLLRIYPNPNNGNFVLESVSDVELRITNELGQLIQMVTLNGSNNHQSTVQGLAAGIYFVNGKNVNSKIVVEK